MKPQKAAPDFPCLYDCRKGELVVNIGGYIKKEREWPLKGGGSLTIARFIKNPNIDKINNKVIEILYKEGYRGQYDIEYLVCEDKVYLNEINFRHSGNGYGLTENGVSAPFYWCLDCVKHPLPQDAKYEIEPGILHMDEINDFRHKKENNLSFKQWLSDVKRTKAFAVFDINDISGTWAFYKSIIKNKLKKLRRK